MAEKPKRGLGRGLSALMSDVGPERTPEGAERPRRPDTRIPIEAIRPNPDQPRRSFNDEALDELASSIREKGVIQPIIVRRDPADEGRYQIVAGERRWRAAQRAQLHDMPVLVRDYSDTEVLEVAIIENIQRADLNPVDEAQGYRQLMDRFGHTQDQLASALGKSRSHIANQMRLLALPPEVLDHLTEGRLTAGHARALIGHPDAPALAAKIVKNRLSVRDAEKMARAAGTDAPPRPRASRGEKDADTRQIEGELAAALGMGVSIDQDPGGEGGRLTLRYRTLEQLDDLLRALSGG
ncbi:ParB/RepB/Spo0J family partition protein [Wenxinia marina]|uniref:ParB-like partition protein n=1 Tax=Wenxinia marina DSM 24838 TaxID=1123501 RepID=A0A0D0NS46_9RHOB|nr:ParB/RepB/Spo0J family partition protein [Wenxinia marina]KIQ71055.1 ParB-like partition protein [Wenxinia marina DSM 24838]GGL55231.1 chromosome partitioning protein ParB [Wenxinia marina]